MGPLGHSTGRRQAADTVADRRPAGVKLAEEDSLPVSKHCPVEAYYAGTMFRILARMRGVKGRGEDTMTRFCGNCGSELDAAALASRRCPACGVPINATGDPVKARGST